jgi:hypothetical protein
MNNMRDLKLPIEPKKTNRWIIKTIGVETPEYTFSKYKLYNNGDKLMFETTCFETIHNTINPVDLFNLTGIELQYLDPIGNIIGGFSFDIKSLNFSSFGDYSDDDLLRYSFIIEVNKKVFRMLFKTEPDLQDK